MKSAVFCLLGLLFFFAAPAFAAFHDNGNGTVTDSETGLTWQKAADSTARNWQKSLAACANLTLGGQSDWRLPNRNELQSIVDYRYADPAIDSNFFPNTSGTFWTSTTVADSPSTAYTVDFSSGAVSYNDKTSGSFHVRAVRGGATPVPPTSFFSSNGNGTVTDSRTGLVWRQVPLDVDGNGAADSLSWQEALAAATGLNFAGQSDWRLPNRNELQSIVDYRYAAPAIDTNIFPNVTGTFWTSTTVADSPSTAYMVDFSSGAVSYNDKASGKYYVLAVRSRASVSTGSFKFFGIPEKVTANAPFSVEVVANDSAFNGTVYLYLQDGGGIDPASVALVNGRWKGNIAIARSGKTRLIALYAPLNGDFISGSSEWFEVVADQNINADLQVSIEKKKAVYTQGDIIDYKIYVSNRGEDAADNVVIDLGSTDGFIINAASCFGINGAVCTQLSIDKKTAKFKAGIKLGQYAEISVYGPAQIGFNSITMTAEAHDEGVNDPLPSNNKAVSLIATSIPDLPGSQTAELRLLPSGFCANPADLDTVVLTHGLQEDSCTPDELWTGAKSEPSQAGYLIQQETECKGNYVNIYQFFWKGACQQWTGVPTVLSYTAAQQNVYFAAQQLAKQLHDKLGPNYDKKIHFIGHSLGTAVNAYAAKEFLTKATKVSTAQVTILDYPHYIGKIAGFILNDDESEKQLGFGENFFADTLPFDRPGLNLYVDNYYSANSDKNKARSGGVGSAIKGEKVFNRDSLKDSHEVGDDFLSNEGVENDHSGVHQWYRWSMRPKEEENFTGSSVCNDAGTWNRKPEDIDSTLNPCKEKRGGWRESILLHDTIDFPPANGGEADKKTETAATSSSYVLHGCISAGPLIATTCSEPAKPALSPSDAARQTAALAEEPQIPKSSIEFTVTVPEFLRYISFDYSFGNIGDGDYVYIFLDGVPVWKIGGDGLTAGETVASGLIPVRAEAGQKKLIIALYGVGEQNAQFSLNNFKFTTVADTDGDGRPDDEDAFPNDPSEWLDTDNDGIGNNADLDDDNDGVVDSKDAFPFDPSEWSDTDGDGQGDNADADDDNDGIADSADNCPRAANPQQGDEDKDGIGDACDTSQPSEGKWPLPAVLKLLLGN